MPRKSSTERQVVMVEQCRGNGLVLYQDPDQDGTNSVYLGDEACKRPLQDTDIIIIEKTSERRQLSARHSYAVWRIVDDENKGGD